MNKQYSLRADIMKLVDRGMTTHEIYAELQQRDEGQQFEIVKRIVKEFRPLKTGEEHLSKRPSTVRIVGRKRKTKKDMSKYVLTLPER